MRARELDGIHNALKKEKEMNLQDEIKQLREKLTELEKRAGQPDFEVGKWYVEKDFKLLIRVSKIDDGAIYGEYFDGNSYLIGTSKSGICRTDDIVREATPSEIETALRKEWERRCEEVGADPDNTTIESIYRKTKRSMVKSAVNDYILNCDQLIIGGELVYCEGKWATPKQSNKFFDWGVKMEGDRIVIGCESYDVIFLKGLTKSLHHVRGKTVNEVLTELKKLDLWNNY